MSKRPIIYSIIISSLVGISVLGVCPAQASTSSRDRNASVRVDRTPPSIDIKYPSSTRSNSVMIYGSVSKDTASLAMNGEKVFIRSNGYFEIRNVPLPEKENIFKFEARDTAGNTTKKTIKIISYWDRTPPVITIKEITQGGTYDPGVKPEIKVSDSQSDVTQVILLDDEPFVSGTAVTEEGKHLLIVKAVDSYDNSARQSVRFRIAAPTPPPTQPPPAPPSVNHAPVLNSIANITVYEGATINFNPTASDPDGDTLTFSYSGWMTTASYAAKHSDAGAHTVTVTVSDGSLTDSQNVQVTVQVCGDAVKNGSEVCDEGVSNGTPNHCNAQCVGTTAPVCGNGVQEAGEVCEVNGTKSCVVGGYAGTQSCTSSCTFGSCTSTESCGDGVRNGSETCDEGASNGMPNHCNTQCTGTTPAVCGNNIKEGSEGCDDGNKISGDGCSAGCVVERCGDGIVQTGLGEACEGNSTKNCTVGGYAGVQSCTANCAYGSCVPTQSCGDGVRNGPETCDEGTNNGTPNHCNAQCTGTTTTVCGNNIKESGEACDDGNKISGDGCSASCVVERCGDGVVQTAIGEACEGNTTKGCQVGGYNGVQTCVANTCVFGACAPTERCGDGVRNGSETCDEGASNGTPNHCNAQCSGTTTAVCGNNIKEGSEGCDDGNKISGDGCSASCVVERCGDGIVQTGLGEVCEGNSIRSCVAGGYAGTQSCTANCTYSACAFSEFCGDGSLQAAAGEACDDGNKISGDGCSSACKVESCGDGIVQTGRGEQCDDGNATAGDGCNASCKNEYCGDGIIQTGAGEVCDSNARSCTTSSGYSGTQTCSIQCIGFNTCTTNLFCGDGVCSNPPETTTNCPTDCPAICGNGIAEPSEQCDDHNTTSGDGCSATCRLEICGDGIVQTSRGEQCDDSNIANGDGCNSICQQESVAPPPPPPSSGAGAPVIFYTDIISGPRTGGEGNNGAYLTISGKGFGTSRGTSTVKIGGGEVVRYIVWSDTKVSVQLGSAVVSGNVVLSAANGSATAPEAFAVRPGNIFFVSLSGADNVTCGAISTPCRSPNYVKTNRGLAPGDFIYVRGGDYDLDDGTHNLSSSRWMSATLAGTTGNPITFSGYPGETVNAISDTGVDLWMTGTSTGVDYGYWVVANFKHTINTMGSGNPQTIQAGSGDGACPGDASGPSANYSRFINLEVYAPGGVSSSGSTPITLNHASHSKVYGALIHDSIDVNSKSTHVIYLSGTQNDVEIAYGEIYNMKSTRATIQLHHDSYSGSCWASDGAVAPIIDNIRIHDMKLHSLDGQAILADGGVGYVEIYNNLIYDVNRQWTVAPEDQAIALRSSGSRLRAKVYNNTLYVNPRHTGIGSAVGFGYGSGCPENIVFQNNVVVLTESQDSYFAVNGGGCNTANFIDPSTDHNVWYNTAGSTVKPSWDGPHSSVVNPLFVNPSFDASLADFHLQSSSPAIDAGINVPLVSRDYDGISRPQGLAYDIGAYEYGGSSAPPPSDTTAPAVSLMAPANNANVSGTVNVAANASDDVGVLGVQFKVDGTNMGSEDMTSPYSATWNTAAVSNGTHTCAAVARDAAGNTQTSAAVTVTVNNVVLDTQAPTIPTGLSATAVSSSQINLSWSASTDNVGVTGYRVYRCQGASCTPSTQIGTSATTTYQDTGLTASTAYTYRVAAIDAVPNVSGQSANASATTQATAPPPPTGSNECSNWQTLHPNWIWCDDFEDTTPLSQKYTDYDDASGRFVLVSSSASHDGSHMMSSRFDPGVEGAGGFWLNFGRNPAGSQTRTTQDFNEIYWRMYIKMQTGWSVNPQKFTRARVVASSNWSDAATGHLWEGNNLALGLDPASGVNGSTLTTNGYNDFAHYTWLGAQSGTTQIFDNAHANQWQCVEVHMKLNTPGQSDGVFEFSINGVREAIRNNLNWRGSWQQYGINHVTIENWVNGGAMPITQYRYWDNFVVSTQPIGCGSTAPVSDTTAPSVPTGLTATATSSSQINLSWTASTDNVGVTGYRVFRNSVQVGTSATASYSSTGLSPNTNYAFTVLAYDAVGNESNQSSSASATTQPALDTAAPSAPAGLTATAVSSSQINLSWNASTDNVGVTGYRIYRCQGSSCTPSAQVGTSAATTYADTGLTAATAYIYRVAAVDAVPNVSGQSANASATTQTASSGSGTNYYVDGSCANNGNGLADQCATSAGGAGAFKDPQSCLDAMTAGDTCLVKKTATPYTTTDTGWRGYHFAHSGTAANRITLKAYDPANKPILRGCIPTDMDNEECPRPAITTGGQEYVTIDGIYAQPAFDVNSPQNDAGSVDCFGRPGHCGSRGITIKNSECSIGRYGDGNWTCLWIANVDGAQIDHNYFHDVGAYAGHPNPKGSCLFQGFQVHYSIFEYNTVENCTNTQDAFGPKAQSWYNEIRYNLVINAGGIFHGVQGTSEGSRYHGNVFYLNQSNCLNTSITGGHINSLYFYNNTCYNATNPYGDVGVDEGPDSYFNASAFNIYNNIFSNTQWAQSYFFPAVTMSRLGISDYNSFAKGWTFSNFSGSQDIAAWRTASGKDANSRYGNCAFQSVTPGNPNFLKVSPGTACDTMAAGFGATKIGAYGDQANTLGCVGRTCGTGSSSTTSAPVVFYTDITSGPNTGGKDNRGAIVCAYGKNFGTSNQVFFDGVEAGAYIVRESPSSVGNPSLDRVCVQPGPSVPTGAHNVIVRVSGVNSTSADSDPYVAGQQNVQFTVRPGNIYFVALNSPNNPGTGTYADPFRSPNSCIYSTSIVAGDICYFRGGTYDQKWGNATAGAVFGFRLVGNGGNTNSGTQASPIAFLGYPGEDVFLNAACGNAAGNNYLARGYYAPDWITLGGFRGNTCRNGVTAGTRNDRVSNGWRMVAMTIDGLNDAAGGGGGTGLIIPGRDGNKTLGNYFYGGRTANKLDHSWYSQACGDNIEFGWNKIADSNFDTGPLVSVNYESDRCTVEGRTVGGQVYIHDNFLDATNYPIRCVYVYEQQYDSGETVPTAYVYNNVFLNCGASGTANGAMVLRDGGAETYNNTFVNSISCDQCISGPTPDIAGYISKNNLYYHTNSGIAYHSIQGSFTVAADYNLYFGGTGSTGDAHAVMLDPRFVSSSDFHLQSSSPAINAGVSVPSVLRDLDGKSRPQGSACDIGAYEY